jgi:predicted DNA-binding protein with PD1-like motif
MIYREGGLGRVFVLRMEHGDILHPTVERFCREKGVKAGFVTCVGGVEDGSRLVVGPKKGEAVPIEPMIDTLKGVHEATGTGTVFPNENGEPILHMHIACGRDGKTVTGCGRPGIKVWRVLEVMIVEIVGMDAMRRTDPNLKLEFLAP